MPHRENLALAVGDLAVLRAADPTAPVEVGSRRQLFVGQHLIGGMKVRIGDTVYDGSVRNRLERLRVETINHTAQTIRDAVDRFAVSQ